MVNKPKKILLTGGRSTIALELARQFKASGHTVYVADCKKLHICRFSNSIKKSFSTPSPRYYPDEFIEKLIQIIEENDIDLLIPTCEEIMYISGHLESFPKSCQVFCSSFDIIHELHSKWLFNQKVESIGLTVPKTQLVRNQEDLNRVDIAPPYVLKATYSRACQNLVLVEPNTNQPHIAFEPYNPWVAQKWIDGEKYCTYSVVHNGKIHAQAIYPVRFTVDGSSCITFEAIRHEKIFEWVTHFMEATKFTGQVAFDFIQQNDGSLYAIECNPRATHGLHMYTLEDKLPQAFFGENETVIKPKLGTQRQLAIGMAAFGWRQVNRKSDLPPFHKIFFNVKDVVFSKQDPKPFISMSFIFPMYWLTSKKYGISIAEAYTHDMEWNGDRLTTNQP
ncbi:MAG: hypothetical protein K940chlam3_00531 [Chlamydiae bacterium]|nr:hypothetical protein [Chlamydiota bacterium]